VYNSRQETAPHRTKDSYKMIKLLKNQADFNIVLGFYLKTKYYGDAVTQG
jgi:hypothetical protein